MIPKAVSGTSYGRACSCDPHVSRYYACESLYNIAKVARQDILKYFNQIFDGYDLWSLPAGAHPITCSLCKLFADVDVDVKNGANLLDRLVKDIVTESEVFDVELFIPLLHKYIRMTNPYIRQLLVPHSPSVVVCLMHVHAGGLDHGARLGARH